MGSISCVEMCAMVANFVNNFFVFVVVVVLVKTNLGRKEGLGVLGWFLAILSQWSITMVVLGILWMIDSVGVDQKE